jgi:CHAD domain-containing protein
MKQSSIQWNPDESAALNARRVLPKMVRDYFKKGRKLDRDSDARAMHGFRLRTKQLRYTLEAFIPLYGPGLKPKVESLRPIQNALGDFNDCEVLLAEMRAHLPHDVRTYLTRRADEKRKDFLQYWREKFDAADEDKKWENYLTRSVRVRQPQTKNRS